jgi:hypothetical protein
MLPGYEETIDLLVERITPLLKKHPEILTIKSAWELFDIKGFKVDDLGPSLFQASKALAIVQQRAKKS